MWSRISFLPTFAVNFIGDKKMERIKNIVFDFGGVIVNFSREAAVKKFEEIGVANANELLDAYHQKGAFLQVEDGTINAEEFRIILSELAGKELSYEQVKEGWLGFMLDVPQYRLEYLLELRKKYKLYILSNTNPYVMSWARSNDFTIAGRPLDDYFDKIYTSYELKAVKPGKTIFELMIKDADMLPGETLFVDDGPANIKMAKELGMMTFQPINGEDWRDDLTALLK
jgi:haloacid dehalogenase superfamily, subfamily IA, variant 3 with third motif having DD or ED